MPKGPVHPLNVTLKLQAGISWY